MTTDDFQEFASCSEYFICLCTAAELLSHRVFYDHTSDTFIPDLTNSAVPVSDVGKLISMTLQPNQFAELAHMYALSAALDVPIQSYMPQSAAVCFTNPYTCVVRGRSVKSSSSPAFALMWTMQTVPKRYVDFRANHFVWLRPRQPSADVTIASDDDSFNMQPPTCEQRSTSTVEVECTHVDASVTSDKSVYMGLQCK